ncbi:GNAT family N-acetyltransferase [Plesiomonas shigelloides]|uniref:GNAT family N-acetyltransferase n=1 Tax=Plesiomonas shigelloides TaxID=703 RepID=UPI0015B51750|nr:GNAT family N-acetyltransferase [Plesiomonas shigelloides]
MKIEINNPNAFSKRQLDEFEKIVVEAGEVQADGFRELLESAYRLVFLYVRGKLAATGAIKIPRTSYRNRVFLKASVSECADQFPYEAGWIVVTSENRGKGLSTHIVNAIIEELAGEKCYATTRADNLRMHKTFRRTNFSKLGEDYNSSNGNYNLGLFCLSS